MKPAAEATVVFHSAHADVWRALADSLRDAGLAVVAAGSLDKTQGSFKQVSGHVTVSGDPLLRVRRTSSLDRATDSEDVVEQREGQPVDEASSRQDERRFSQFVGLALVNNVPVTIGAKQFYAQQRPGGAA
jgi:hypothetical protein